MAPIYKLLLKFLLSWRYYFWLISQEDTVFKCLTIHTNIPQINKTIYN